MVLASTATIERFTHTNATISNASDIPARLAAGPLSPSERPLVRRGEGASLRHLQTLRIDQS
jgi:hypothetical protein